MVLTLMQVAGHSAAACSACMTVLAQCYAGAAPEYLTVRAVLAAKNGAPVYSLQPPIVPTLPLSPLDSEPAG